MLLVLLSCLLVLQQVNLAMMNEYGTLYHQKSHYKSHKLLIQVGDQAGPLLGGTAF